MAEQVSSQTVEELAKGIHRIAEHLETSTIPQVPLARFKPVGPFNPEGKRPHEKKKLKRQTFQNGFMVKEAILTEAEIEGFNKLTPGRYGPDRKWVVRVVRGGGIELRFPNKTFEERMDFKNVAKNIGECLAICIKEAAERKERRKKGLPEIEEVDE